ncbi:hypothetical protein [Carboxydocella sp. JDF658]|uniref:hypothetical protein n=1 Tax=Carboxydocella sp. JDF658 TaxID=1926600 RepID=UPI0009AE9FB2|nr:hypothetical protein [Carboxydocella sp. JDF658]
MLQKVIFHLIRTEEGSLQGNGGLQLHGWFFRQLAQIDEKAATELHELEFKPFALSPLVGSARREDVGQAGATEERSSHFLFFQIICKFLIDASCYLVVISK